ncbi:Hypothetical_protein [Hexamita inflata]|uniref:Hypothetical_protein n=1 Tax=Hexamita inflata TaxID=28002 RepID=A0AA86Q1L8_9EUKA|nr:Hypothetical protein HINF_LOCUS38119 [Hexamita inflata]
MTIITHCYCLIVNLNMFIVLPSLLYYFQIKCKYNYEQYFSFQSLSSNDSIVLFEQKIQQNTTTILKQISLHNTRYKNNIIFSPTNYEPKRFIAFQYLKFLRFPGAFCCHFCHRSRFGSLLVYFNNRFLRYFVYFQPVNAEDFRDIQLLKVFKEVQFGADFEFGEFQDNLSFSQRCTDIFGCQSCLKRYYIVLQRENDES